MKLTILQTSHLQNVTFATRPKPRSLISYFSFSIIFIAVSCSIMMSDSDIMWSIFAFAFGVKIFFIYEGLALFIVLKISVAKVLNL